MRVLALLFGRCLALALVLEFADVPIACADEWASKSAAGGAEQALDSVSLKVDSVVVSSGTLDSGNGNDVLCYCPCHLTFQSASGYQVRPPAESIELAPSPSVLRVPSSSRSLEHPPQN
jgi:hypothetical protein